MTNDLSDTLARRLQQISQETGRSRNALVREAVESWLASREQRRWPQEVLDFQGVPDAVPFEQSRADLLIPWA
ncbi:MAG: ribbon-helix-helix protein, CopG family [Candidatus Competibacteraceae bacterium]